MTVRFTILIFVLPIMACLAGGERHDIQAAPSSNPFFLGKNQIAPKEILGVEGQHYKAGEVLVKFKPDVTREEREKIAKTSGLEMVRAVTPPNLFLFKILGNSSVKDVIKFLGRFEGIEYAEPNYIRKNF